MPKKLRVMLQRCGLSHLLTTSTFVNGSDVFVSKSLLEEDNGILETSHRLTQSAVVDQKAQMCNGNEGSNASWFNPQGQLKSTSSKYLFFGVMLALVLWGDAGSEVYKQSSSFDAVFSASSCLTRLWKLDRTSKLELGL
jgi:hypothetical protein